jgi:NifU-like protein involved in Fe-S cluster formation
VTDKKMDEAKEAGDNGGLLVAFTGKVFAGQFMNLPPVKIHCSVLAEDAIKAAVNDYRKKNGLPELKFEESVVH